MDRMLDYESSDEGSSPSWATNRLLAELADAPHSKRGSNKVESRFDSGAGDQDSRWRTLLKDIQQAG